MAGKTTALPLFLKNHYLLLSLLWLLMATIANPLGEFPLNDDWSFCRDVQLSVMHGRLELIDWAAMTLVSQIALGAFCCKMFGFSFTLLRILTSIVGLAGALTTYRILKEHTANSRLALFIACLIIANPLFFSLSNTFMTDVYFFTFSALSVFFFQRSLGSGKKIHLMMAMVFVIVATLTRQIGIVIPVAYAVVSFYKSRFGILRALLPLIFTGAALYCFNYWMSCTFKNSTYFAPDTVMSTIRTNIFPHIFYRIGTVGMTLGLFLFPLLLLLLPHYIKSFKKRKNKLSIFFTVLMLIPLLRAWTNIPLGNMFNNLGVGPRLLKDAFILHINNGVALNAAALNVVRAICLAGGILLFYYIFSSLFNSGDAGNEEHPRQAQRFKFFSFIIALLLFGTFVIPDFFFDRYIIQLYLPVIVIILPPALKIDFKSKLAYVVISIAFIYALLTTALTHDYLSWNRARWQGLHYLMSDLKKSPQVIDGGFEFNGWYQTASMQYGQTKSWWFVDKDDYILTFGPLPGYKVLKTFPYKQYVPFEEKNIYILYKDQK